MCSNAGFQARLEEGKRYESYVCEYLKDHGIDAVCPEDTSQTIQEFTRTNQDVLLGDGKVLEVKSRRSTCVFTGPEDFPYDTVFVDTTRGWERKDVKPFAYVIVSQDTGAMVWIDGSTRDQWGEEKIYDKYLGYPSRTLTADKGLLKPIDELVEILTPPKRRNRRKGR